MGPAPAASGIIRAHFEVPLVAGLKSRASRAGPAVMACVAFFALVPTQGLVWAQSAASSMPASRQTLWPQWLPKQEQGDLTLLANRLAVAGGGQAPSAKAGATSASWQAIWTEEPGSLVWNNHVLELVVKYRVNPLRASRAYALLHVAGYEATRQAGEGGLPPAAQRLALHAACSTMMDFLFPLEAPGRFQALGRAAYLAHAADGPPWIEQAWALGQAAAARTMARALLDGSDQTWRPTDQPPMSPGRWRATPPLWSPWPVEPLAARWQPWVSESTGLDVPPPVPYDTPAYWQEAQEVLEVGRALTPEQKKIAEDWNLESGSVTPAGVWNRKAGVLVQKHHLGTAEAAPMFAALNVAMADAMTAAWRVKYQYWTQRPVTAIHEKLDPNFMPHLRTPAFPSYVSGHANLSGAASEVLAAFFPDDAGALRRDAEEAALSRLYGGIHFRSDNEVGLDLGRRVGQLVVQRLTPAAQQAEANPQALQSARKLNAP